MMRDVIERFRYRFELWRREWREDLLGPAEVEPPEPHDYVAYYADPKRSILLTESTLRSIGRTGITYFGIIAIAAQICLFIGRLVPFTRFACGIVFVLFAAVWTLASIFVEIDLRRARKQYRQQQVTKSSNQALQLTAARRDEPVSIHEPPFRPNFPRFRQR
jgi:hypothetical protein